MYAEHFKIKFIDAKNVKIKNWSEEKKIGTAAQIICRYCGDDAYNTKGYQKQIEALNAIVNDDNKVWMGLEIHLMMCNKFQDATKLINWMRL